MRHLASLLLSYSLIVMPAAAEETPALELLLFLTEFTDEEGNWDAPELDEQPSETAAHEHPGESDGE
jgi:hypothetical protein